MLIPFYFWFSLYFQFNTAQIQVAKYEIYSTQENGAIMVEVEGGELLRMEKWQKQIEKGEATYRNFCGNAAV